LNIFWVIATLAKDQMAIGWAAGLIIALWLFATLGKPIELSIALVSSVGEEVVEE
jgi:hypothetical protein